MKISYCCFQYASPYLWNQIPASFCEPPSHFHAYLKFSTHIPPYSSNFSIHHSKLTLLVNAVRHRSLTVDTPGWLPRPMGLFSVSCLLIGFYRATACNAMHDIALAIVSVGLSVTLVDCDKTKWYTVGILTPHERAIMRRLHTSKICAQSDQLRLEKRRLRQISAYMVSTVRDSKKFSYDE